ncbi:MAG: HEPN domain-containing protein [Thermoflexibacter sp.]|jgi:HEPN domain-containing protein|nr:HEPN domain-containing protein [Thermoflexibacter sp.]
MEIHEEWFYKANSDLESAKVLLQHNLLDTAHYHTQQSAEKALKGYLAFRNQPIQRIHNLNVLLANCIDLDDSFSELSTQTRYLNGFDTKFRYPDEELAPERSEVQTAINYAEVIFEFVKQKVQ